MIVLGSARIKLSISYPIVKEPSIGITLIDHCLIHGEWISYLILVIEDSGIVIASFFILRAMLITHNNSVLLTLITVKILIIKLSNRKMTLADVLRFILKDGQSYFH